MTATTFPRHIPSIPYSDPPSRLQTLDIWLPRPLEETTSQNANAIWLVYIHGGAWRDPEIEAISFEHTVKHLVASHAPTLANIAGIASLNYRLSPYPDHKTQPSTPSDPERSARHPQHIRDVGHAIQYLQREYSVKRWIGIGHSCGATMLCQLINGIGLMPELIPAPGPEALILISGLYNLPLLVRNHLPPTTPAPIAKIYRDFMELAFGEDEAEWQKASPVTFKYNAQQWPEGKLLILCHSYEDELVERTQRDVMCVALDREGWNTVMEVGDEEDQVKAEGRRVVNVRDLKGGHDWIWEDGKQIAILAAEAVERLV
jgi:acetyl esterase/lipase